ncbi:hypothetical protein [Inconstantimicrobium mannanitabidum]|uniref:Uncharacterized protein n=1 Tax=Inconstantimicrobium mannanitabidum TaxID=1604901 RepID=A0ACB5RD03_9CLOT|nr:hypothetical protein [Clostridium sp. TW13]GKX66677.1 hypothetical protein rsdtw13_19350 [Clostridium sp. TW13]
MKSLRNLLFYFNESLKRVKLVDRCLIIFMIILMTQSIYNLFFNESTLQNSNVIDIVVRTTSASIFGYFLSSNFLNRPSIKKSKYAKNNRILDETSVTYENKLEIDNLDNKDENEQSRNINEQQIVIATVIGVISLVVLLIARNMNIINTTTAATISQLRDFVAGSVGFLLGCPIKRGQS